MSRVPGPPGALRILQLGTLAALACTLAGTTPGAVLVLLLAALLAGVAGRPRPALLLALAVLAGYGASRLGRGAHTPASGVARIGAAESEFRSLAARARARVLEDPRPGSAFARLDRIVEAADLPCGMALYEGDAVVAWAGDTTPVEPGTLGPGLRVRGGEAAPLLVLTEPLDASLTLVVETRLDRLLVPLGLGIRVLASEASDVEAWLRSASRQAAGHGPAVPAPVRLVDRDARVYAIAEMASSDTARELRPSVAPLLEPLTLALSLLGIAALTAWTLRAAPQGGSWLDTALLMALLLGARLALAGGRPSPGLDLFNPASLAVVSPFGLLSSPGDLFLTGVTASGLVAALVLVTRRPGEPRSPRGLGLPVLGLASVSLATLAALVGLRELLARLARNSELDLADFSLLPAEGPRLAAILGLAQILLAALGLASWLALRAYRWLRRGRGALESVTVLALVGSATQILGVLALPPAERLETLLACLVLAALTPVLAGLLGHGRGPALTLLGLAAMVATLCLGVAMRSESRRALRRFVEHDLADLVERHPDRVRLVLEKVLSGLEGTEGERLAGRLPEDIGYLVWKQSALSRERLQAAIDVVTPRGHGTRFAYQLPLPPGVRSVPEGPVVLQDVLFQGRHLRVLAGSRALPDGTLITVRVVPEPRGLPFFQDRHHPRELLAPGSVPHAEPLSRAAAVLAIQDQDGRVVYSTAPPVLRVDPGIVRRVQAADRPVWWSARAEGIRYDALSFAMGSTLITIMLPRPPPGELLAALVHATLLGGVLAALLAASAALVSRGIRARLPGPRWVLESHYRKVLLGFTAAIVIPALAFSLYQRRTIDELGRRELRAQAVRSLDLARQILAEYITAEPGAPLDDATVIWLSQTVGYDLSYFRGDRLQATTLRELVREGYLPTRPLAAAWVAIRLGGAAIHVSVADARGPLAIQASAPIGDQGLLTLYSMTRASELELAAAARTRILFLATAGLVAVGAGLARIVARGATRPVEALTAAAVRVGGGDFAVRLPSRRRDEVGRLMGAFNRMAEKLREQRDILEAQTTYLSQLVENAPIGVLSLSARARVETANAAARQLLGERLEPGEPVLPLLTGSSLEALGPPLTGPLGTERLKLEMNLADGSGERTLSIVVIPLPASEGTPPGRLVLLEDISGLVRSKKLEAWAEMARRIAHEIKNPLTPIQLAAEHMLRVHRDGAPGFDGVLAECVASILKQVQDLRRISREFSAYAAGPRPVEKVPTEVGPWLGELSAAYRVAPRPGVRLDLEVQAGCGLQRLDPARLQRALANLIENALLALGEGGEIRLRASRPPSGELLLEVEDTGPGIPPELQARLFEPYFSTRHGGTGLGLANARQAVLDHGGRIELASEPGRGTSVRVYLPAQDRLDDPGAAQAP